MNCIIHASVCYWATVSDSGHNKLLSSVWLQVASIIDKFYTFVIHVAVALIHHDSHAKFRMCAGQYSHAILELLKFRMVEEFCIHL